MKDDLKEFLAPSRRLAIVGVGNPQRGDDAAGPAAVERVMLRLGAPPEAAVFEACSPSGAAALLIDSRTAPENYICEILDFSPDAIVFIDCASFSDPAAGPGTVRVFDEAAIAGAPLVTSHSIPLTLPIAIARQKLPGVRVAIAGIQPACVDFDSPVSEAVRDACAAVAADILSFLQ